ncbi:flavin reductase family protein [Streptomyces lavendulae]|uniref:flavin reductase family protein n=1 Tax=Streptomyces lavendulae TaxID=1914 RepID=UPI0036E0443F
MTPYDPESDTSTSATGRIPHESVRAAFLSAMRTVAASVAVVTTSGPAGRYAQTVSSLCSVSADPPTVLVCINRSSPLAAALVANGAFTVSVLGPHQVHVAESFAGHLPGEQRYDFGCTRWAPLLSGVPAIQDGTAAIDCRLHEAAEAGTHIVAIGKVLASRTAEQPTLTYRAGAYGTHTPQA